MGLTALRCVALMACFLLSLTVSLARADSGDITGSEAALTDNILLTIDDCSNEHHVRLMFEILRDAGYTAVFFPNTRYITQHDAGLWQEIVAAGFEIGYHTRFHQPGMTANELAEDFAQFVQEVKAILDDPTYTIQYVRPPDGQWDTNWNTWAQANSVRTVRWNVTVPADLNYIHGVLRHPRGGGIFLLHTDAISLEWLLENLSALATLTDADGHPYRITTLTTALTD